MKANKRKLSEDVEITFLSMLTAAFGIWLLLAGIGASDSLAQPYLRGDAGDEAVLSGKFLVWVNREGGEEPISIPPDEYRHPKISPDSTQVALTRNAGWVNKQEIWILNLASKHKFRITDGMHPIWSSDGERIIYGARRQGRFVVVRKAANGSGKEEQLASSPDKILTPWCLSHDGNTLLVFEQPLNLKAKTNIATVSMTHKHGYQELMQVDYNVYQPQISSNGQWLAYTSDESGHKEVFVCPYPQVSQNKWQISTNGGDAPLWSPDGRELFFRSGGAVVAVPVKTESAFSFDKQTVLFRGNYLAIDGHIVQTLEISPDGKRFLLLKPAGGGQRQTITYPMNLP
jgi:Tol biopolymer transport system component